MNAIHPLVWLDLETTGLNTSLCVLLQIGVRHTTPALETVSEMELLVRPQPHAAWDDIAKQMHIDSGLLAKATHDGMDQARAFELLTAWLENVKGTGPKLIMAGNTIHFDRAVLESQGFPTRTYFHHRHLDASFFKAMYLSQGWDELPEHKTHTSLGDIENSIASLRRYMSVVVESQANGDTNFEPQGWFA